MLFHDLLLRHPPISVLLVVALLFLLMGLFPGSQWVPERATTQATHAPTAVVPAPTAIALSEWAWPNCEQPRKLEEADWCEQRRMAQAAETTVLLSKLQIVLGILGAIALVVTLYYNRQATNAATVSANAATASANAMMDGERPHMVLSILKITKKPSDQSGKVVLGMKYRFTNYGKTPAFMQGVAFTLAVGHLPESPPNGVQPTTSRLTVAPGRNLEFDGSMLVNSSQLDSLGQGGPRIVGARLDRLCRSIQAAAPRRVRVPCPLWDRRGD
jgi:hypothetical protein